MTGREEQREVIARIIDPEAFDLIAHYDGLDNKGASRGFDKGPRGAWR